jgi:molybdate/tungstate transport system substrate-binding protein
VNLGNPQYSSFYGESSVVIVVGGQSLTVRGAPIQLAITIPKQAPNKALAEELILFLITPRGQALMRSLGIQPLVPAIFYGNISAAPLMIRVLVNSSLLMYGGSG